MFRGVKQEENIPISILLVLLIESQEAEKALQLKSLHNATEKNSLNSKQNGIEEGEKRHGEKVKKKIGGSTVFSFFTQQLKNWCSMIELLKACSASGL